MSTLTPDTNLLLPRKLPAIGDTHDLHSPIPSALKIYYSEPDRWHENTDAPENEKNVVKIGFAKANVTHNVKTLSAVDESSSAPLRTFTLE